MNTKYARLANGQIEYAPDSIETDAGIKVNPSAESYLAAGWKKVVDEKPAAQDGHIVAFSRYDESADSITLIYKQVKDDTVKPDGDTSGGGSSSEPGHRKFSKLKLVAALKEMRLRTGVVFHARSEGSRADRLRSSARAAQRRSGRKAPR